MQAPLPWDEERCVALARAIMSINKVYVAAPADVAEPTLRKVKYNTTIPHTDKSRHAAVMFKL